MEFKEIVKLSENDRYVYPDIFDLNIGLDIVDLNNKLHSVPAWRKGNRKATLVITSFLGISSNAQHFYGEIEIDGVQMAYNENPNMTTYISARENPLADYKYILPLKRYLTQDEIDKEPRRWEYYEAGDLTICFYTQNELLDFAKEIFKHRFSGEWEFYYKPFRSNTSIKIENI